MGYVFKLVLMCSLPTSAFIGQSAGSVQGFRGQLQGGPGDSGEMQPRQQPIPEDIWGESKHTPTRFVISA